MTHKTQETWGEIIGEALLKMALIALLLIVLTVDLVMMVTLAKLAFIHVIDPIWSL